MEDRLKILKSGFPGVCDRGRAYMKPPGRIKHQSKKPVRPKVKLELRPVIDRRMPTIGNNAIFCLKLKSRKNSYEKTRFADFSSGPPNNMQEIRTVISNEIQILGRELAGVERMYYGRSRSAKKELERVVNDIKLVCGVNTLLKLDSVKRIDALVNLTDKNIKIGDQVKVLKNACFKVLEFVPDKLADVTAQCRAIYDNLNKYGRCFYDRSEVYYLGTADNYLEQISLWKNIIDDSLDNITKMATYFRKDGISENMLSKEVLILAEEVGCQKFTFLLIFVEACANVRKAVFAMTSWLKYDNNYITFIRNDVTGMEKGRDRLIRDLREAAERYHTIVYRQAQLENDRNVLSREVSSLKDKEDLISAEKERLTDLCEQLQLETDIKEIRREDLKRLAFDMHPDLLIQNWDSLSYEIRELKYRLPRETRQLNKVSHKLKFLSSKTGRLEAIIRDFKAITSELILARANKEQTEKEYNENEKRLELMRKILVYKSSSDAIRKIYYDLPLQTHGYLMMKQPANLLDPVNKAFVIAADLIENDWPTLYRALPFYPSRGEINIENDICSIVSHAARESSYDLALMSLRRWRRFHTRVKASDVIDTLRRIRRHDIALAIDREINPEAYREKLKPKDEKPPPVPPELIPFYRQVERYDELRASNKLKPASIEIFDCY